MLSALPRKRNARRGSARVVFVVILFCCATAIAVWHLSSDDEGGGAFVKSDYERHVGGEIAKVVTAFAKPEQKLNVGVLRLFRQSEGPYVDGLEELTETLADADRRVKVYDVKSARIGPDDDYTAGVGFIARDHRADVIVVLVHGGFESAKVTPEMHDFFDDGGRLILVGRIYRPASPILDLVSKGKVIAIVRNSGPLAKLSPQDRTLSATSPEDYFQKYYTVLTSENIAELLPPKD